MNEWLAQMYNTNGVGEAAAEEQEKLAQVDLFCKLAARNNIDLSQMSQEEIGALYTRVFPESVKTAQEEEEKEEGEKKEPEKKPPFEGKESDEEEEKEEEEEKKEGAAAYLQEKRAFQEKFAEADLMGRVMAHSFTQELNLIKEGGVGKSLENLGKKVVKTVGRTGGAEQAMNPRTAKAIGAGTIGTGVAAAGGAAAGAKKLFGKKKEETEKKSAAQQFEELAANRAIKIAEAYGIDPDLALNRVSAVYTLGMDESEKVASVQDLEAALNIRGLEYLEAAGWPVNWDEVLPSE